MIFFLLITFLLLTELLLPDTRILWSFKLDKERRDLYKKLGVKEETHIIRRNNLNDTTSTEILIYKSYFNKNAGQNKYEFFRDSITSIPNYSENYVTDDSGNILKAFSEDRLLATQEFDNEGRLLELINYDEDGDEEWLYEYEYDENDNLILEIQKLYGEILDTLEYNEYKYINIDGKFLIKSQHSLLNPIRYTLVSKIEFEYDSLCREISYREYDEAGKLYMEKQLDYSQKQGIKRVYGSDSSFQYVDYLELDEEGKLISRVRYSNSDLLNRVEYQYNERGILTSIIKSHNAIVLSEEHINENGKDVLYIVYGDGMINSSRTTTYSEEGLILNSTYCDFLKGTVEENIYNYQFYQEQEIK